MTAEVRIVRSAKRKKTLTARQVGDVIEVRVPQGLTPDDEQRQVAALVERVRRKASSSHIDLAERAAALAATYGLQRPDSISWSSRQLHRWGSCSIDARTIRISDRLAAWPVWVLDYVIVHELAHLDVAGHGADFHALVDRYPLAERARGYLLAKGSEG